MKEYGTIANLPREGHSQKPTDQARRALIREATKRLKITLKELQSSTAEIVVSVHSSTLSHTLHRVGLYGRVARKKPLLKEKKFAKRHVGDSPNIWKNVLWSDETKIELFGHQGKRCLAQTNTSHHPENTMVVAATCCGDVFQSAGTGKVVRIEGMMDGAK